MPTRVSDLIDGYEAARQHYETCEPQTRDWGGTFDPAAAAELTRQLAEAEGALKAALERVGPVARGGKDYRVWGGQLIVGPAARDADAVDVS